MTQRFRGRGALITGGTVGIGRSIAQAFLSEGARVVIADVDKNRAIKTAGELSSAGQTTILACDVTNAEQVADTVRRSEALLGGIEVLVNNAGVSTMSKLVNLWEEDWDYVMDVNVKGVYLMMRAALPGMLERGRGSVVNIASQAGKRGYRLFSHYCASKAAVILLSKGVALEVAPTVRVNCVCPGIVNTEMQGREYEWEESMTGEAAASIKARLVSGVPMGRFQEPEHIARVALFLASDDASEMTGQAINVTGGMVTE